MSLSSGQNLLASLQNREQHRHTGLSAVAAILDADDKGKGHFRFRQKTCKHCVGLLTGSNLRGTGFGSDRQAREAVIAIIVTNSASEHIL